MTDQPKLNPEDLLYAAIDTMSKPELELLRKDIDEEIELRKYKDDRIKRMKMELNKEQTRLIAKFKMDLEKQKMDIAELSSDEDEIVEVKPKQQRRRNNKK
jgi:hypothetical protein